MDQYRELVHSYLDGGLDPAMQDALFEELGRNEELRREFDDQVVLHRLSRRTSVEGPSEAMREALFSRLGIASESSPEPVALVAQAGLRERIGTWVYAGIGSSLLLAGLLWRFGTGSDEPNAATKAAENILSKKSSPAAPNTSNTPAPPSRGEIAVASSSAGEHVSRFVPHAQPRPAQRRLVLAERRQDEAPVQDITPAQTPATPVADAPHAPLFSSLAIESASPMQDNGFQVPSFGSGRFDRLAVPPVQQAMNEPRFNVEVRNASAANAPAGQGLGLAYRLSENYELGIQVSREGFLRRYERNVLGATERITETSALPVIGLSMRAGLPQLSPLESTRPFAQVVLGGSTTGFVGRTQLGLEQDLGSYFRFSIGAEYTYLPYQIQGRSYTSEKTSIVGAMHIRF